MNPYPHARREASGFAMSGVCGKSGEPHCAGWGGFVANPFDRRASSCEMHSRNPPTHMKKLLPLFFSLALTLAANATVIPFDLLGRSGVGMRFDNENPTATGSGTGGKIGAGISYDNATKILTLNVGWGSGKGFTDLTGTVSAAHLHGPTASTGAAAFTQNAAVLISLDGATAGFSNSATNGGWTNTVTRALTAAEETNLLAGQFYLNAHTTANPGGEIRGNLVQVPEPSVCALALSGIAMVIAGRRRKVSAA